ncbi:2-C-methyl-D-erythritol 2,4-cyclodiphosphate synthase [Porphyromonas macacae]|nr:2-C-methyl-D-erythritol 2,4-cyclodiphosphate synthase [Porphyromonas macacae]
MEVKTEKMIPFRIGFGYDVHRLCRGRELWLGGIRIDHEKGLDGHSDADVALHALSDALLGAAALGDIGTHFPPSDMKYKDIDSKILLREVITLLKKNGYRPVNADITIAAEKPKLRPHIDRMREVIAGIMDLSVENVSVKATTTEKLGFTGREEGIAAHAVCLVEKTSATSSL